MSITEKIKQKAHALGFDLVGIAPANRLENDQRDIFEQWLNAGCAGQMQYLHRNIGKRFNPAELLPGAKSVIVAGLNYKLLEEEIPSPPARPFGTAARYARYEDYHLFIKSLLRQLAEFIVTESGVQSKFKMCVDSVPLAERAFAVRAGIGFIGRNRMLINPELGPEIFLGELVTDIELEADKPADCLCTDCDRCIRACPTGALQSDGGFDARKCISYLTIEHKGQIDEGLTKKMGDRLFGCDECVLACPYHLKAPPRKNKSLKLYPQRANIELDGLLNMTNECFEEKFLESPLHRSGLDTLKRNARICLENFKRQ